MQKVLVVDKNRKALMPCHPARARELLKKGKAAILRRFPFTIILLERENGEVQAIQMKLDTGAKTTGVALVAEFKRGLVCIWAAELEHRGFAVRDNLLQRRQLRRGRRHRKTRYRATRFDNRRRAQGWLAPSLLSRWQNIETWFKRLASFSPVSCLALELTKFDTQLLQNPEIRGIEYQQGELWGYEIREYLVLKWAHHCAYCGEKDRSLEIEHIIPKSRGGSNRISNLSLACHACNQKKGSKTAAEFGYPHIQAQAKQSLADAAVMNKLRWAIYERLQAFELPIELGTGGLTKFNRTQQGYPKSHWMDAACVGNSGATVFIHPGHSPLLIRATGRQSRQMVLPDRYGFPRTKAKQRSAVQSFRTGDLVKATVLSGKKAGVYLGRVAVRTSGSFNISTKQETVQGISYRHCQCIHKSDGYTYTKGEGISSLRQATGYPCQKQ
jgi:5-methylcytosine-specific restriction endonuclease McrA